MKSDMEKSKDELLEELTMLRAKVADANEIQNRLADLEQSYADLQKNFE
jgi:predicted nuclease with TOPRIM domain